MATAAAATATASSAPAAAATTTPAAGAAGGLETRHVSSPSFFSLFHFIFYTVQPRRAHTTNTSISISKTMNQVFQANQ